MYTQGSTSCSLPHRRQNSPQRRRPKTTRLLFFWIVLCSLFSRNAAEARNGLPRSSQSTIPRSTNSRRRITDQPPWNPSALIDEHGFLKGDFKRKPGDWEAEVRLRTAFSTNLPCRIRQVPGDGNCLFHSLSLCLQHATNGTHWDMTHDNLEQLYDHSQQLRAQAVACLRQKHRRLFLQGHETLRAHDLVTAAAQQYDMTPEEYCNAMEEDCVWGGGPEIVALCNTIGRPIHVYELALDEAGTTFVLRRMACFGSPRFDRQRPLHILSADSRFPDLLPGQQLAAGNHFLAVFPQTIKRRKRIRGGAGFGSSDADYEDVDDECMEDSPLLRLVQWWKDVVLRVYE